MAREIAAEGKFIIMVKVFKPVNPAQDPLNLFPYQERRDFIPVWVEFAAQHYEQVVKRGVAGGGFIYTVPKNFILFITSCWISSNSVGGASLQVWDKGDNAVKRLIEILPTSGSISQNFIMPIKIESDLSIVVDNSAGCIGGFSGFLVPFVI